MKTLVTVIALSVATIFSTQAQDNKSVNQSMDTKTTKQQPQQDMTAQIQAHTDQMTKDLNLTADQSKKVMAQNKTLYTKMSELKTQGGGDASDLLSKYDSEMKRILKQDQYTRYESMKAGYIKTMSAGGTKGDMDKDTMRK